MTFAGPPEAKPGLGPAGSREVPLREELLRYFDAQARLVEEAALQRILQSPSPWELSRRLLAGSSESAPLISEALVLSLGEEAPPALPLAAPRVPASARPPGPSGFCRLSAEERKGSSTPLEGVSSLLHARFRHLARILRNRPELSHPQPIASLAQARGETALIGMVVDAEISARSHHLLLEVEDDSGSVKVLVPKELPEAKETYLPDEMLGLRVLPPRGAGSLALARAVYRPDVPLVRRPRTAEVPSRALFLSDLHLGSKGFLTEAWLDLVEFLKGRGPAPELAERLDYLVLAGDLVDGIGVYPGQEADLTIADVVEQYAELSRRLREIPSRIGIVALPGNHDAVCPAEPQPALPAELLGDLPPNVHLVSNPSTFSLDGVVVTAYHGRSFDELIPRIPHARYEEPLPVMRRMLSMRHLGPTYGGKTPLAPSELDGLLLDPLPDILVTGHTHTFGVERWRGRLLINASTWLAETEYQRLRNIRPDPGKATWVDLQGGSVRVLDFLSRGGPSRILPGPAEVP